MILKSKLGTKYPTADPKTYLKGDYGEIDPVFAGRLAYVAKINNTVFTITDGYRSLAEQEKLYKAYKAGKLQATAAVPGTSWHGSRLAVDTSTKPIRQMTNVELKRCGLVKPIFKEGWHIQPIETANMGVRCDYSLSPVNLTEQLIAKGYTESQVKIIENYTYPVALAEGLLTGKKLSEQTNSYLAANGIKVI